MNEIVRLCAVIVQMVVIVAVSARHGLGAGLLTLLAVVANSVQAVAIMKMDTAKKPDDGE